MANWLTHLPYITRQAWSRSGRSFSSSGKQKRAYTKIVLHSTETTGFPGYANGAANPHFTISLASGSVRQHVPLNYGARALMIGGSRLQNTGGVIQIEIIGAVTPGYPRKHGHYDLPNRFPKDEQAQFYLARLIAAIIRETGIPNTESVDWLPYPASSGNTSARLNDAQFVRYRGMLPHSCVPYNTHGDCGALPVRSVLMPIIAKALRGNGKPPVKKPGRSGPVIFFGAVGKDVGVWQTKLAKANYDIGSDGVDNKFGSDTDKATWRFQRDEGIERDKRVGPKTRAAMKAKLKGLGNPKKKPTKPRGRNGDTFYTGSAGADVKAWQLQLIGLGISVGGYGADGKFGAGTQEGTEEFEKSVGYKQNGTVTESLRAKMKEAHEELDEGRIAGDNRYATAAAVALAAYPKGVETAYLAAEGSPDAQVAAALDGPVLLVKRDEQTIPAETADALEVMTPEAVVAIGGDNAVSDAQLSLARIAAGLRGDSK